VGASALTSLGTGFAQGNLLSLGARLTASRQRVANLVVTNVPGPQFELRMGKHELLDMFPMVPLGGNLRLGVAILSYNGKISFGLVGDFDAMPDLGRWQATSRPPSRSWKRRRGSTPPPTARRRAPCGRTRR
jgi:hypothetical protein